MFLFSKKNKDLSAKDVKIGRFIQMSFEKHGFSLTNAFSHLYGSQSVKVIGSLSQVFYGIAVFKKVRPFNLSGAARSLPVLIDFSRSPGLSSFFFSIACLLPQTILFAFQTVFFWHIKFFFGKYWIEHNYIRFGNFFLTLPVTIYSTSISSKWWPKEHVVVVMQKEQYTLFL